MWSYEGSLQISKIIHFTLMISDKVNSLHTRNIVLNQLLDDHPFFNQTSVAIVRDCVPVIAASVCIIMLNKCFDWYMKAKTWARVKK